MTKQMTKIAMIMVLAIGLMTSSAMAQKTDDNGGVAPVGIYTGIQTDEGILDPASGMTRGNTFSLNSSGESERHHLTISIDYQAAFVPDNFIVTGGSWTLLIFRNDGLDEVLYGEVRGGSVVLISEAKGEPSAKQVSVMLISTAILGVDDTKQEKQMSGVYDAITDLNSPRHRTSGSLSLAF